MKKEIRARYNDATNRHELSYQGKRNQVSPADIAKAINDYMIDNKIKKGFIRGEASKVAEELQKFTGFTKAAKVCVFEQPCSGLNRPIEDFDFRIADLSDSEDIASIICKSYGKSHNSIVPAKWIKEDMFQKE